MRLLHRPWRLGQSAAHLKKFDHIIIETTGLADPAPVAFTFFINPEIADHYRIDSILCLADAKHLGLHLEEEKADDAVNEAVQQVAFADRILLNKIDLVDEIPRGLGGKIIRRELGA